MLRLRMFVLMLASSPILRQLFGITRLYHLIISSLQLQSQRHANGDPRNSCEYVALMLLCNAAAIMWEPSPFSGNKNI